MESTANSIRRVRGFDVTVGMQVRRLSSFVRVTAIMPVDDLNIRRLLDENGDTITIAPGSIVEVLDAR